MHEAFANGLNRRKFADKVIPEELASLISYTIQGRARTMLAQVPMIAADL
jgi:hypothetical protein